MRTRYRYRRPYRGRYRRSRGVYRRSLYRSRYRRPFFRRSKAGRIWSRKRKAMNKVWHFKSIVHNTTINCAAGTIATTRVTFQAADLYQWSALQPLFDLYKINLVKIVFAPIPQVPSGTDKVCASTSAGSYKCTMGTHYMWIDYNDTLEPTDITHAINSPMTVKRSMQFPLKIIFKPKFQSPIYESAVYTAYGPKSGWINMNNDDVPHYGIKYLYDTSEVPVGSNYICPIRPITTVYWSAKNFLQAH